MTDTDTDLTQHALAELADEAAAAGDTDQVRICLAAMHGDADALAECARVIRDARALAD